jgi:hypothetical protein
LSVAVNERSSLAIQRDADAMNSRAILPCLLFITPLAFTERAQADLSLLAAEDSERSRREAAERIKAMTPKERRGLRGACQNLDALIEETRLEELRDKRIGRKPLL